MNYTIAAAIAACVAIIAALMIISAIRAGNAWAAHCESQGGHVVHLNDVSTTKLCVTADGRILDVQ